MGWRLVTTTHDLFTSTTVVWVVCTTTGRHVVPWCPLWQVVWRCVGLQPPVHYRPIEAYDDGDVGYAVHLNGGGEDWCDDYKNHRHYTHVAQWSYVR